MNAKKIFQILLLTALPFGLASQTVEQSGLPSEYWPDFLEVAERVALMEASGQYDVILDPIEQIPIPAEYSALATGNWGPEYLGINARYAEIASKAKRKICVFVLDTGGKYDHPALAKAAWNDKGKDFTGTGLQDAHGHSTHVAGIVGAIDPSTPLGAARMLVDAGGLKIVPVKVLNDQGGGTFTQIVAGTLYANTVAKELMAQGWFCIYNYSLGGGGLSTDMENALKEAEALGVYVVAACGNTGGLGVQYPGKSKYVSAIAALMQSGTSVQRATYSTYGPETFIAAPGSMVLSTYKGGYSSLSGTSMATPHAAGVVAIIASLYPSSTAASIKAHIQKFATDLPPAGKDDYTGYGSPLISALIDNAPGGSPPPPDPEKRREMRTLTFAVGTHNIYWKRLAEAGGELKTLPASITVNFKTDLYDEPAYDLARSTVTGFFTNRGFILKDEHGFADAAFYSRHFFNMLAGVPGLAITTVIGKDALGREVIHTGTAATGRAAQRKTKGVLQFAFIKP